MFLQNFGETRKRCQFVSPRQAPVHLWLKEYNGSANQITAFALVYQYQKNSTKKYG